jgi:hypothetical protein
MTDIEQLQDETDAIVEAIKPLLAGKHPSVQGVVLADLLATWLAGHPLAFEDKLIESHLRSVRKLMRLYREQLGTEGSCPPPSSH